MTTALARFRNLRFLTVYTIMPYLRPEAGRLPHHQAHAVTRECVEDPQRLKEGVHFEKLSMNIEIEELQASDECQRTD